MLILHQNYEQWVPNASNATYASLPDGQGGVYFAGPFEDVIGGVFQRYVIHFLSNGKVDPNFISPFNNYLLGGSVYTLALYNGELIIGGGFNAGTGVPYANLFSVNAATGVPTSRNFNVNSAVYDLDLAGDLLYVGGAFTSIGLGFTRHNLAAYDLVVDQPTPWNPDINSIVYEIFLDFDLNKLYIAGIFSKVNGGTVNRRGFASFDLGSGLVMPFDVGITGGPGIGTDIKTMNGKAYITGYFTGIHGYTIPGGSGNGAVDALTGDLIPGYASLNLYGWAFGVGVSPIGNRVYFWGAFYIQDVLNHWDFAAVDPNTGAVLADVEAGFFLPYNPGNFVQSFSSVGNTLYVGSYSINMPVHALGVDRWGPVVFTDTFLPLVPPDVPQTPQINVLLRKSGRTVIQWGAVSRDINQNPVQLQGYRVYRSNSVNLENYDLIAEITDLDISGNIRAVFTETISGFYAYCLTAFNAAGESGKSCKAAINAVDLDSNP